MRFSCDKCSTKYTVADEKVRGKVVAVRCTRCGNRITVNGKSLVELPEDETRVAPLDMEALRASLAADPAEPAQVVHEVSPAASGVRQVPAALLFEGWYVIIAGEQHGPLPALELKEHLAAGRVGPRTYVWRDGQGEWKRVADVPEFLSLLHGAAPAVSAPASAVAVAAPSTNGAAASELPSPAPAAAGHAAASAVAVPADLIDGAAAPNAAQAAAEGLASGDGAGAPLGSAALDKVLFEGESAAAVPSSAGRAPIDPKTVAAGEQRVSDDPFAKVPDSPGLSKPGEIGEQTRFFINQSGVNRRNPWWKIALVVVGAPVVLVAILYGLAQMKIVPLEITRVDEVTGAEVKRSVFSSEGISGLKDMLLGANRRAAAARRPAGGVAQSDRRAGQGSKADNDDRIQRPKIDFGGPMNDAQREKAAEIYKGLNLEGPRVHADQLQDRQAVDGKAALDPAVISETIGKNSKAFQGCVETELRRNPGFKGGKVLITASLKPSGIVTAASINKPEVDGSTVGACLKEKARRMVFPAFEGDPFDVEIPLVLTAGE